MAKLTLVHVKDMHLMPGLQAQRVTLIVSAPSEQTCPAIHQRHTNLVMQMFVCNVPTMPLGTHSVYGITVLFCVHCCSP